MNDLWNWPRNRLRIMILDRVGLEEAACEYYQIIHHETLPETIGVKLAAP